MTPLLHIDNLVTTIQTPAGSVHAVNGVSLTIARGRTAALVGESGSGKSMTAFSVMGLLPPSGKIESGSIELSGTGLLNLTAEEMRSIRGRRISMVFQEPMTSLNPVLRIGDQVMESFRTHLNMTSRDARDRSIDLLRRVGIPAAESRIRDYPHQLSGGMRQRVMIAMALACQPELLIADEPTTALDVTIQAQILELIDALRCSSDMGVLLITHDLGIVAERSDSTHVMYAGSIVEEAPTAVLFKTPGHPYTRALLAALPQYSAPGSPLTTIPGQVSSFYGKPAGCGFCDRCPEAFGICRSEPPPLREVSPGHMVRCWL